MVRSYAQTSRRVKSSASRRRPTRRPVKPSWSATPPGGIRLITSPSAATGSGPMSDEHVDVLIVGAAISGVGAACRLQQKCPDKTFAIL
jgi:hypothetical protein